MYLSQPGTAISPVAFTYSQAYITLASEAFEPLVSFYAAFLSQTPEPHTPQRYAAFQLPGLMLAIFKPRPDHGSEFAATIPGPMSLCLEVGDLEGAIATLTQLGYPPPGQIIQAPHGSEIYAYDPAGNRIILHQANACGASGSLPA